MQSPVRRQLGMERRGEKWPLADRDDPTGAGVLAEYLDTRPGPLNPRRPDEYSAQRGAADSPQADVALERVHLAAERVAPHGHVDPAERLLADRPAGHLVRQHDHPGAASESGQPARDPLADRLH